MTITLEEYVGIDVAEDKLDVAVLGRKTTSQALNTKRGITGLVKKNVSAQSSVDRGGSHGWV